MSDRTTATASPVRVNVLCLSRSYLSTLLPRLGQDDEGAAYFHIVQTDQEAKRVRASGGNVILNLEAVVRDALATENDETWREPDDFREITGFSWSALYSDRNLPHLPAHKRQKVARIVFRAVEKIFSERCYASFVSEPVAIFVTHILFYFCRKHGTKPLLWANTYFPDYFYFADATDLAEATPIALSAPDPDKLRQTVEAYVGGVIGDKAGPAYHHAFASAPKAQLDYFQQRRGERPLVLRPGIRSIMLQAMRLCRAWAKSLFFPRFGDYMTAGSVNEHRAYMRYLLTPSYIYDDLPPTHSSKNVVYPLQYEPEASLLYFAPEIVSQLSFVETVLKSLPSDCLLWVKEHPNQFGALGEKEWRELRRRYGNLRFIHGRQSGRELIKRCGPVVTISSSMGMDALLLGRKVLVAGRIYYRSFSGAIPVRSHSELNARLNDAASYEPSDNSGANVEELIEFAQNSYPGDPQPSDILYTEKNLKRLIAAIRSESRARSTL